MAYLEIPVVWIKSPELQQILVMIQDAVNKLNEDNFVVPVSADKILAAGSLTSTPVQDHSLPLSKLTWLEWPIPLMLAPQPASTTSSLDCGGFWVFDPVAYPGGEWYFECAMKISNATYSATVELKAGSTVIASVSTQNIDYTVVRSPKVTMPSVQQALTLTLTSSNTSATAYLWTARMIYVP